MTLVRFALAALPALVLAAPAQAYWEFGHETVAKIAYANVTPQTRRAIDRLLAETPKLDTPECPATTIEGASTWADCVKPLKGPDGKSRFGYAYTWHFQDVNICQPFTLEEACKDGNCVSAQITRDVAILKNKRLPVKERAQALVFLIHFVGDLHQPLHAGEKNDKGGNDVAAAYGSYSPKRFNLHSIWDGTLAERAITTGPSLVRRYPRRRKAPHRRGQCGRLESRIVSGRTRRRLCERAEGRSVCALAREGDAGRSDDRKAGSGRAAGSGARRAAPRQAAGSGAGVSTTLSSSVTPEQVRSDGLSYRQPRHVQPPRVLA